MREQNINVEELESKIHSQENAFKKLEIISDDNEPYNRRSCLRIQGIKFKDSGVGKVMEEKEKYYNVLGIPFDKKEIDGTHDIGSPSWTKNGKEKLGQ